MSLESNDDFLSLLRLIQIEGLGNTKIKNLVNKIGSPSEVLNSDYEKLVSLEVINKTIADRIINENKKREFLALAEEQIEQINKNNVEYITLFDADYPISLKNIYDAPLILYYKGTAPNEFDNNFGIVGTRMPTSYGKSFTEKLVKQFQEYNITIVSGLARGIDTTAHISALKNGMKTIAVLGTGLNYVYPAENKKLFYEIAERGCLLTEYPLNTKPDGMNFPKRNRIISGLSLGVIIVQSDKDGGAMLTAEFALDQNREVFAVPGNVDIKQSAGPNLLIQNSNAKLITSAEDIFVEFGNRFKKKQNIEEEKKPLQLNLFEEKIFMILSKDPVHIDQISEKTNLTMSECLVHLLSMEFKGFVRQLPGKYFVRDYF